MDGFYTNQGASRMDGSKDFRLALLDTNYFCGLCSYALLSQHVIVWKRSVLKIVSFLSSESLDLFQEEMLAGQIFGLSQSVSALRTKNRITQLWAA